jgi:hypothetical protein
MRIFDIFNKEDKFVNTTSVRHAPYLSCPFRQTHFRYELIDEDHNANGTYETAEKGPTQHTVQEPESKETCEKDNTSSKTGDYAGDLGIESAICFTAGTLLDICSDDLTSQERSGGLWTDHHLRAGTQDGIYERVEDKAI